MYALYHLCVCCITYIYLFECCTLCIFARSTSYLCNPHVHICIYASYHLFVCNIRVLYLIYMCPTCRIYVPYAMYRIYVSYISYICVLYIIPPSITVCTRMCVSYTATHINALQHTATHCNTLQHTATHCNTLQHAQAVFPLRLPVQAYIRVPLPCKFTACELFYACVHMCPVYRFMRVYICVLYIMQVYYTHTCRFTYVYIYVSIHKYTYIYKYTCIHLHIIMYMYVYTDVRTLHLIMYIYIC